MKIKKELSIIIACLILFSCEPFRSSFTRENVKSDVEEAEVYIFSFYDALNHSLDSASTFFYEDGDSPTGLEMIQKVQKVNGKLKKIETENVSTTVVVENEVENKDYYLQIMAEYEEGKTIEKFNLKTIKGKLVIYNYEIEFQ